MEPVVRVAAHREQDAAKSFAQQQEVLTKQVAQLEELKSYRVEYSVQFQNRAGDGVSATALQDYRQFIDKLDLAIQQQELEVEQFRRRWLELKTRCNAMDKVVERFRTEERREADRREQSEMDERSSLNEVRRKE